MMQPPDQRLLIGQETFEREARIRLNPFDQGRRDDQDDPADPRLERNWFKRFWAKLRGRRGGR
jgi:hypothetical protein